MSQEIALYQKLEHTHNHILRFWNYLENENQHPHKLTWSDNTKYIWRCDGGHNYSSSILEVSFSHTVLRTTLCTQCYKKWYTKDKLKKPRQESKKSQLKPGKSFGDKRPDLVWSWDYHRNGRITPFEVSQFASKRFWWMCKEGHIFDCLISNRNKYGCPTCRGWRVRVGFNDLYTQHPQVAKLWHPTLNGDLTPEDVTIGYEKTKIWWQCDKDEDHVWQATPWSIGGLSARKRKGNGTGCPYCSNHRVSKENSLSKNRPEVAERWNYNKNEKDPSQYAIYSNKKVWWICEKGHEWFSTIISATYSNSGCPECFRIDRQSRGEKEMCDFIKKCIDNPDDNSQYIEGSYQIINPYQLDVYLPDKKLAFEYNGIHWHSDSIKKGRRKFANRDKWKMCKDKDIQLITIWEDEWLHNQEVVKSMIRYKIGSYDDKKVFARKTSLRSVSHKDAKVFLDQYHIQGYTQASVFYGLFDGDELVAVSAWRKLKNSLYLDRYTTSCQVVGGMGKMLKYGKQYALDHDCDEIVTFSDHCVSDGGLYEKLGFEIDKELEPDYKYVVGSHRYHKFNYRKKRFKNDSNLLYDENMTELELAEMNGLRRVWDCGKTRYRIII